MVSPPMLSHYQVSYDQRERERERERERGGGQGSRRGEGEREGEREYERKRDFITQALVPVHQVQSSPVNPQTRQ